MFLVQKPLTLIMLFIYSYFKQKLFNILGVLLQHCSILNTFLEHCGTNADFHQFL